MSFQPGCAATTCKTASRLTPSGCIPSLGGAVQVAHQSIPLTRQGDPMNRLTLTGRLTADPELHYSTGGTAFCSLRIAVNGVGDDQAMFLDITTFGKEAEACGQHLHKGRRIGFDGRLQHRSWTDDDGTKRSKFSGAGHVEFLDNAPPADATGSVETTPAVATAEGDGRAVAQPMS
jgi:single-strand DNA-binding protein